MHKVLLTAIVVSHHNQAVKPITYTTCARNSVAPCIPVEENEEVKSIKYTHSINKNNIDCSLFAIHYSSFTSLGCSA